MPTTLTEAADAFYAAGNLLLAGDASAFAAIWSEADDVSHLGPTGSLCIGRTAVMEQFAGNPPWASGAPSWLTTVASSQPLPVAARSWAAVSGAIGSPAGSSSPSWASSPA